MSVTISSTYLGSTALYKLMAGADDVLIEVNDHYSRQTFRNRCLILGPNGVEALTIPVIKPQEKTLVQDIIIDGTEWRTQHWRAIEAAYNSSPFLEFYADDLLPFYTKQYRFLVDFNFELQQCLAQLLGIKCNFSFTTTFHHDVINDYRGLVEKKSAIPAELAIKPYYQVFREKFGFTPGLSALDLLLNEGPEAVLFLQ